MRRNKDKKSLYLNGNEALRIEFLQDEAKYFIGDKTGMTLSNKEDFISLFRHLEYICTNTWSNKVRKEYQEIKDALGL